jgi:GNAT superfamily N-acetyltransferase
MIANESGSEELSVVRLSEANQVEQACPCMVEVPVPWPEALQVCRAWIAQNLGTVVEGLHLQDGAGNVVGHVYYASSERALIPYQIEDHVAVVYCEWVQRRHQGKGYARLLSEALIRHLDDGGYKGILVMATDDEQYMHYTHFVRRGFRLLQQAGSMRLMYYPLRQESVNAQPLEVRIASGHRHPTEVIVFAGGLCPHEVSTSLSTLHVAHEFGDRVVVKEVAATVENLQTYGVISGVFINGRRTLPGGASEEAIRQAINDELGEI